MCWILYTETNVEQNALDFVDYSNFTNWVVAEIFLNAWVNQWFYFFLNYKHDNISHLKDYCITE